MTYALNDIIAAYEAGLERGTKIGEHLASLRFSARIKDLEAKTPEPAEKHIPDYEAPLRSIPRV